MTRQELIDFCLTFLAAYEDYPFDKIANENATTVMCGTRTTKKVSLLL